MYYILSILFIVVLVLIIRLIKVNRNLKGFSKENNSQKKIINSNSLNIIDSATEPIISVKLTPIYIQPEYKQQHYYIVKEILINKTTDIVISTNEYEFANENLHISKTEARLFYDNKIATCPNKDKNSVFEYKLYIANDIFFDAKNFNSISNVSKNEIKKYLLIDSAGKTQTEGRDFESFALSASANKMNKKPYDINNQVGYITTKNSFLDGNYKD